MAEFAQVGVDAARVEDIVAAAGVSWGTFFHYFPAKEDVLLVAAADVSRAYSRAALDGLEAGEDTATVFAGAFSAMREAALAATSSAALRTQMLTQVLGRPGRLTAVIGEDVMPPIAATSVVMAEGQRRGEVRSDEPAEALAVIVLYSVLFTARRDATFGRPPGAKSLGWLALETVLRGLRPDPEGHR
jgi:TetR/AcrR family transcriptional regulator, fatty acid metabolism regulator protein